MEASVIYTIRTLLVDNSIAFLASLRQFLADHPRVRVVGAATSGRDGVAETVRLRPDLVLLDLIMPGMTGLEALPWIKAVQDPPRVIILTFQDEPEFRNRAMALGADEFITKAEMAGHILPAIKALFPEAEATQ